MKLLVNLYLLSKLKLNFRQYSNIVRACGQLFSTCAVKPRFPWLNYRIRWNSFFLVLGPTLSEIVKR